MTASDEKRDRSADALAAMADGQEIGPKTDQKPETSESAIPSQDVLDADKADTPGQGAKALSAAGTAAPESADGVARKARAASLQRRTQHVHAEQFKRMMIPLLLVTGIMLLVLGIAVATIISGSKPLAHGEKVGFLENPSVQKALVVLAFPLAAILLAGAWLFREDLKRGERADQEAAEKKDAEG